MDCRGHRFVSDIVLGWQKGIAIRRARGPDWGAHGLFYVQIGVEDTLSLSGIPPGAVVSVEPISPEEQGSPSAEALHCLQFGNGYLCGSCTVSHGKLILLPVSGSYSGVHEFFFPKEVRVVGRVRGFASVLPPKLDDSQEVSRSRQPAPLVLPWEQSTFDALLKAESLRFGLSGRSLVNSNDILSAATGTTLSSRTVRRYQHEGKSVPHTNTMLALTLFHGARISDVLRSLHLWRDEVNHRSLTTWLQTQGLQDLSESVQATAAPQPHARWRTVIKDWLNGPCFYPWRCLEWSNSSID